MRRAGGGGGDPDGCRGACGAAASRSPGGIACASSLPGPRRRAASSSASRRELGWEFIQIYGLTETAPLLTINRAPSSGTASAPPRGSAPLAGRSSCRSASAWASTTRARCSLDRTMSSTATGTSRRSLPRSLVDGWFHTGDGGHLDGPYVVISDRKKDVIISGGENVSSIEVEDALYGHPAVAEVAVIGVPHERWGETVKALVVLRARDGGEREGPDRVLPVRAGALQVPDVDRVPRRTAADRDWQIAEVQAAPAYWAGRERLGQLTVQIAPSDSRVSLGSSLLGGRSQPDRVAYETPPLYRGSQDAPRRQCLISPRISSCMDKTSMRSPGGDGEQEQSSSARSARRRS